jgi:hypothetical protein
MNDAHGQPLCIGSGFFISSDVVATNAHVIEGAGGGTAKLVGVSQTFPIEGILAIDHHSDLALVKVSSNAPALPLSKDPVPSVGDNVFVIGNPLGLEGTFSPGIVSGIRASGADSLIQMTAPISPGSSGGPVLDSSGSVVGVAVGTFKDGQNLNLAVPVSYLVHLNDTRSLIAAAFQTAARPTPAATILDGLGTSTDQGVIASDLGVADTGYAFSLENKLPVQVSHIKFVIVFYDKSTGEVYDFDRCEYTGSIPAGLTKPVACSYRLPNQERVLTWHRGKNGGFFTFKAELRVIGFMAADSPY